MIIIYWNDYSYVGHHIREHSDATRLAMKLENTMALESLYEVMLCVQ